MSRYVIIGRGSDCNLVINDPSVSQRHARMSWKNGLVLIEDLHSSNGVWVEGKRVEAATVRPGEEVLLGTAALPWARKELKPFLRLGASGTMVATPPSRVRRGLKLAALTLLGLLGAASAGLLVAMLFPSGREAVRARVERLQAMITSFRPARSDEEAYIRARLAPRMREAIDATNSDVRNAAVRIAAREQGTFRVEQVAAIWSHVRERWRYVNDPQGREYFAHARETIANEYAGDCDDFAITLAAMIGAIGGDVRVIFMEGPRGGHAYTEACIQQAPTEVATQLSRYYTRQWARYTSARGGAPSQIAYRSSSACQVWLNLDWYSTVPGGDYSDESWAVAIYPDGTTETLATAHGTSSHARAGSAPRSLATPPPPPPAPAGQ